MLTVLILGCLVAISWCRLSVTTRTVLNYYEMSVSQANRAASPCDDGWETTKKGERNKRESPQIPLGFSLEPEHSSQNLGQGCMFLFFLKRKDQSEDLSGNSVCQHSSRYGSQTRFRMCVSSENQAQKHAANSSDFAKQNRLVNLGIPCILVWVQPTFERINHHHTHCCSKDQCHSACSGTVTTVYWPSLEVIHKGPKRNCPTSSRRKIGTDTQSREGHWTLLLFATWEMKPCAKLFNSQTDFLLFELDFLWERFMTTESCLI